MAFSYKGLHGVKTRHIVTEEEIDKQLENIRQSSPRVTEITDRPAQTGDTVVLSYAGFCGETQFPGGTAENQTLTLGSGTFIPGFEEQLTGVRAGEKKDVNVTFPEAYHEKSLAGKPAVFRCTVHKICQYTPYELNDEFARQVGQCDTLAQMRKALGESMQARADSQSEMELQDELLRQAALSLDMTVSPQALSGAVDAQMRALEAQLAQQGLDLAMYCEFLKTTPEQLRKDAEPAAENAVRAEAAVNRIVILEGLSATAAETEEAIEVVCRQNGMTPEQLAPYINEDFRQALTKSILSGKAMQVIRDNAVITEK